MLPQFAPQTMVGTSLSVWFRTDKSSMFPWLLVSMTEKLAYELRSHEKLASCITVRIRYSDFDTRTLQQRIPYTSFDHVLISEAQSLFRRLWQRRMLIRLIGVRVSGLVRGVHQLNMFEDTPEMISLYMAMDSLRGRFGRTAVRRAAGVMTAAERSERELRKASEVLVEKSRIEERLRGWHH